MEIKIQELRPFYTSIYVTSLDLDAKLLLDKIYQFKSENSGVEISNRNGWQGNPSTTIWSWMKTPVEYIVNALKPIYKTYGVSSDPILKNYWYNINERGSYNIEHAHPQCWFSVVLYLKVPENSGDIVFSRPDTLRHSIFIDTLTEHNQSAFSIIPKENSLIIFPSYLRHSVEQNLSNDIDADRVSIAFNFE
jgi:uncharacterized protein (TIGR02466 family)